MIGADQGATILWSNSPEKIHELSALGAMAWDGREGKPAGSRYEWTGFNVLCNAAPMPFDLEGERFLCIDSFYEALKLPEGSSERAVCAMASSMEARRLARRTRGEKFIYRGKSVSVSSPEHESLLAAAICAKIDQNAAVQIALAETDAARLTFPLTFNNQPGPLGRVTPLTLMIERWKRAQSKL